MCLCACMCVYLLAKSNEAIEMSPRWRRFLVLDTKTKKAMANGNIHYYYSYYYTHIYTIYTGIRMIVLHVHVYCSCNHGHRRWCLWWRWLENSHSYIAIMLLLLLFLWLWPKYFFYSYCPEKLYVAQIVVYICTVNIIESNEYRILYIFDDVYMDKYGSKERKATEFEPFEKNARPWHVRMCIL